MNKIYTKSGDSGITRTIKNTVPKYHIDIEIVGDLDELNSWLGKVLSVIKSIKGINQIESQDMLLNNISLLKTIQDSIFLLGSLVAGFDAQDIDKTNELIKLLNRIENTIDEISKLLPELKNFILPGSGIENADIQIARSVCRRVERNFVKFVDNIVEQDTQNLFKEYIKLLNRLSDYLFVLARYVSYILNEEEIIWNN